MDAINAKINSDYVITPENRVALEKYLSEQQMKDIQDFYDTYNSGDKSTHSFEVSASEDKQARKDMHFCFRNNLRDFESEQKVDSLGKKIIRVNHTGPKNKQKRVRYTGDTEYI